MNSLEIRNFSLVFRMYDTGIRKTDLQVITDLNLSLRPGEIHAVVGSGKSLLAHAILGILPRNASCGGEMLWFGQSLTPALQKKLRGNQLALVPQSVNYLDPLMRVGKQVSRNRKTAIETLRRYELDNRVAKMYPFELSGGMARRVMLATAAATKAMTRFRSLADSGSSILLITHDLELAVRYADRISVFYAGTTLETAKASDFEDIELLRHPYSRALWQAIPQNGFRPIPGTQPYAGSLPKGCVFADRCDKCTEMCSVRPSPRHIRDGEVSCHHAN